MGVAFFTRTGFRREIAEGQLQWLRLESPKLNALKLGLYAPARRTLLPAASALLDALKTSLPELERVK
jgi:DNA-binding transcriptional LysR family regulator